MGPLSALSRYLGRERTSDNVLASEAHDDAILARSVRQIAHRNGGILIVVANYVCPGAALDRHLQATGPSATGVDREIAGLSRHAMG